jgi:hypothetical protein
MTERTLSLPSDEDGFISRECPTCLGRFKAPVIERSVAVHYCPYCSHQGDDCWWTPEQLEFIQRASQELIRPELEEIAREFESHSGGLISFKADLSPSQPTIEPTEVNDASEVHTFTCCGTTAKLDASRLTSLDGSPTHPYCPMCGTLEA